MRNLSFALTIFFVFVLFPNTYQSLTASEPNDVSEEIIETNGSCIATWDTTGIRISGWVTTADFLTPIDSFHVQIKDKEFYLPAFLNNSRFDFIIPIDNEERLNFKNSLITITPFIQQKSGYPFYYLFDTYLPFPPENEIDLIGRGGLITISSHLLKALSRCGLKKTDTVLEVGCGLGRVGYALGYYLEPTAVYEGFDIVPALIDRANSCIGAYFQNFHFQHANIYNGMYNPTGNILPCDFVFPYPDESFDFVFLTSVFTHMLPEDVKHYIQEIKRVLRPGGKCMTTAFLLNSRSQTFMNNGTSKILFRYPYGECFTHDKNLLEGTVAYDQNLFLQWINSAGFKMDHLFPGCWCNMGEEMKCLSFQDLLLFTK